MFPLAWCDCSWFRASTLTRGRVPRRNETFGCEIQNLTECIKAKQTADAKGAARPKWWLLISHQLYHISFCFQPNKWPNCAVTVPLFGHRFLLVVTVDASDTSDKSNYWSCHWCFLPITCWKFLSWVYKTSFGGMFCFVLFCRSYIKNSFLVRSSSWHGRTFHVAHTESRGQGVLPRLFTAAACPCDTKQTHTTVCDNYDLWEQIMWQLLKLPGSQLCPAGNEWIWFFMFLKWLDWAWTQGRM